MATEITAASSRPAGGAPSHDEPTLGALVASASKDLSSLVRNEIALAKAELKDDVAAAAAGGAMFGAAAFLGLLATVLISVAIGFALVKIGLVAWLAFLIVAVVYLLIAGVLVLVGLRRIKKVKAPEQSINAAKDTVAALKGQQKGSRHAAINR